MKTRAVLFDLFGTLCRATSPEFRIIQEWRLSSDAHDSLQRVVCGTKFKGDYCKYYRAVLSEARVADIPKNIGRLREIYTSELEKASLFLETKGVLEALSGDFKLGLISNAYPPTREKVLEAEGLIDYFDEILLSYEVGMTKQNPEYYNLALKRLRADAGEAVVVGDSLKSDILASKEATGGKIKGILISSGKNSQGTESIDNLTIIPNLAMVPAAVKKNFSA